MWDAYSRVWEIERRLVEAEGRTDRLRYSTRHALQEVREIQSELDYVFATPGTFSILIDAGAVCGAVLAEGAEIELKLGAVILATQYCDVNGQTLFTDLAADTYTVTGRYFGYPEEVQSVTLSGTPHVEDVIIYFDTLASDRVCLGCAPQGLKKTLIFNDGLQPITATWIPGPLTTHRVWEGIDHTYIFTGLEPACTAFNVSSAHPITRWIRIDIGGTYRLTYYMCAEQVTPTTKKYHAQHATLGFGLEFRLEGPGTIVCTDEPPTISGTLSDAAGFAPDRSANASNWLYPSPLAFTITEAP